MNISTLKVYCLGVLQSKAGQSEVEVEWPSDNLIATALAALVEKHPAIRNELPRCACAIGDELVPRSHKLQSGDELVLLPPVGGG